MKCCATAKRKNHINAIVSSEFFYSISPKRTYDKLDGILTRGRTCDFRCRLQRIPRAVRPGADRLLPMSTCAGEVGDELQSSSLTSMRVLPLQSGVNVTK